MIHTRLEEMNLLDKFLFDEAMEDKEAYEAVVGILLENEVELLGKYRYTFEGRCRECLDLRLEDGAVRIFINTKGTNKEDFSQEFLDFMKYIVKTTDENATGSGSERIAKIHKIVKRIRKSEKAGLRIMQRWEELVYARQDGKEEGKAEGLAQGIIETSLEFGLPQEKILEKLQVKLQIPPEKAAEYLSGCSK